MINFDPDAAISYALGRLGNELSPDLTYHNLWHTEHDVIPAVEKLARMSGVKGSQWQLLRVAAAFHDLGFVEIYTGHEQRSADIAAEVLPGHGFSIDQVNTVKALIMATCLDIQPQGLLEAIMVDADLDVLGRPDFFQRNEALRLEIKLRSENVASLPRWREDQLHFLETHIYYTSASRSLRQAMKKKHFDILRGYKANGIE